MNKILIFSFVILLVCIEKSNATDLYVKVNTEVLNIREGAGTEFKIVGKAFKGDVLHVFRENGNWRGIETEDGIIGYVSTDYITYLESPNFEEENHEKNWINTIFIVAVLLIIFAKIRSFYLRIVRRNSRNKPVESRAQAHRKEDLIHICKICGYESNSISHLNQTYCYNSPTKKHQAFTGGKQSKYICKSCGIEDNSLKSMSSGFCHKSFNNKHQPFEGGIQSEYLCKHCGFKDNNLKSFLNVHCHKNPTNKHEPFY